MKNLSLLRSQRGGVDKPLLITVLGLLIFGVIMVFNASIVDAIKNHGDKFYFIKRQLVWSIFGLFWTYFFSILPYKLLEKFAKLILFGAIVLLIAVLIPGISQKVQGAHRWIGFGSIVFQPAEFAKFALVIFLASILPKLKHPGPFIGVLVVFVFLVMREPDLGTTIVISGTALIMYFAAGNPILHFIIGIPIAMISALLLILSSEYRRERLLTFLNPTGDPLDSSYHINQVLIALGSGGLFGVGLGQSRQKYLFLPEPTTDSIFAVIGEELGYIGAFALILVFLFLVWRGYLIAKNTQEYYGRLLAIGITSWIGLQAFLNLSAMVALVPLTGIPLPFVSYGGSALVATLSAIGTLLNISRGSAIK